MLVSFLRGLPLILVFSWLMRSPKLLSAFDYRRLTADFCGEELLVFFYSGFLTTRVGRFFTNMPSPSSSSVSVSVSVSSISLSSICSLSYNCIAISPICSIFSSTVFYNCFAICESWITFSSSFYFCTSNSFSTASWTNYSLAYCSLIRAEWFYLMRNSKCFSAS